MQTWKTIGISGLMLASVFWSGVVQAKHYNSNIEQQEAEQQQRIQDGVQSGSLTPQEAGRAYPDSGKVSAIFVSLSGGGILW